MYWAMRDDATNLWEAAYTIDGAAVGTPVGNIQFDNKGNLIDTDADPTDGKLYRPPHSGLHWTNGAAPSDINLAFDCTQYDSKSIVIGTNQNGYAAGELTNVSINGDGVVVAAYSNGKKINISQLVLAKFQNPGGLQAGWFQ